MEELGAQPLQLTLAPTGPCIEQLLAYAALLRRWNTAFNLVGRGDVHRLVPRHLLDALQVAAIVRPPNLLDIGSGAGLPGMVLALLFPDLAVTLLERAPRKARFLQQVQQQLGLTNIDVVNADATTWRAQSGFRTITARAVSSGDTLGELVRPHLAPDGVLVAQFGGQQDDAHLPSGFTVLEHRDYQLPANPVTYRLLLLQPASSATSPSPTLPEPVH